MVTAGPWRWSGALFRTGIQLQWVYFDVLTLGCESCINNCECQGWKGAKRTCAWRCLQFSTLIFAWGFKLSNILFWRISFMRMSFLLKFMSESSPGRNQKACCCDPILWHSDFGMWESWSPSWSALLVEDRGHLGDWRADVAHHFIIWSRSTFTIRRYSTAHNHSPSGCGHRKPSGLTSRLLLVFCWAFSYSLPHSLIPSLPHSLTHPFCMLPALSCRETEAKTMGLRKICERRICNWEFHPWTCFFLSELGQDHDCLILETDSLRLSQR